MSALAKKSREAMQAKARRLAGETVGKVDSSNWTPAKPLNTEKKTGLQPLGERMGRKAGGRVEGEKAVVDAYVNRDVKAANAKAEGKPHDGGYKRGGKVEKAEGGGTTPKIVATTPKDRSEGSTDKATGKNYGYTTPMAKKGDTTFARGGRTPKKDGGGNWIKDAIKKPGALHKSLGVKEGEKIPEKKLEKAEHSKNKLTAKRARLAETLKGLHKKDGGKVAKANGGGMSPKAAPASEDDMKSGAASGSSGSAYIRSPKGFTKEYPTTPRPARASGGKVKGKTNISVNILAGGKPGDGVTPAMMPAPQLNPMPAPMPAPAPAAPPPALPIPNSPMPMGRKAGGRVYRSYKDMDAGACSGDGRLEKTEIAKKGKGAPKD